MASRAISSALTPFHQAAIARSLPSRGAPGFLFNTIVGIEGRKFAISAARPLGEGDWEGAFSAVVARRVNARVDRLLPVVATGCHDGYHWVAYETGRARPLVADGWRQWPVNLALDLVSDVGNALDDAAAFGIVPYELLPSSIFMDARLGPLLGDLGAAREVVGSPPAADDPGRAFTPPEVIAGGVAGARSGVYVCGALLYAMLTGGPPRQDPITRWRADVSGDIEAVMARAMAPDTLERYRTATEFCESARRALGLDQTDTPGDEPPAAAFAPAEAQPETFDPESPTEPEDVEPLEPEPEALEPPAREPYVFEPSATDPAFRPLEPEPQAFKGSAPAPRAFRLRRRKPEVVEPVAPEPHSFEPSASDPAFKPLEPEPKAFMPPAPEPEVLEPEPEVFEPEPEMFEPEPDLLEPEVFEPKPEVLEPEPEVFEPEPDLLEPEVFEPEPEMFEPEADLLEPEVFEPEPEVFEPEPEVFEPEPDLLDPEVFEPEPEGFEPATEPEPFDWREDEPHEPETREVPDRPADESPFDGAFAPAADPAFQPVGDAAFKSLPESPDDYEWAPPSRAARLFGIAITLVLLAAAAAAGFKVAQPDPAPRVAGFEVTAPGLHITLPAGWNVGETRGRELVAAYPTSDWLAGLTIRGGEKVAAAQTGSDPVRLGNLDMWRDASDAPRVVRYVLPTSTGSFQISCEATTAAAQSTLAACERSLSTLSLDEAKPLPLAGVVRKPGLRAALEQLRRSRIAGRVALARARTPKAQRAAALRLQHAYARAANRLEKVPDTDELAASAAAGAGAYRSLASLAGSGNRPAWRNAATRVRRAEAALADELAKQS